MSFEDDLRRFGPASSAVSREEAKAYCAKLTATHYENFSVVTWLTPREHRPAFQSIYAFCRWSDDLGDEVGDPARSLELLDWWRGELRAMYEGRARHPVMVALEETVARYEIPIDPFEALIDAFVQDQSVTEYLTYPQLADYCTRSANPVGHLVLHVAGAYSDENARLSDATCTALQLANFWQDVARDLAIGRIYLPREDRDRFGYPESDLRALRFTPAFAELMKFEVDRTRRLFEQGRLWLPRIPGRWRSTSTCSRAAGWPSWIASRLQIRCPDARPTLGKWTKIGLIGRALLGLAVARLEGAGRLEASHAPSHGTRPRCRAARTGGSPVSMDARLAASYGFCGEIARREARNFYFAFRLLPRQGRMSMCALYAFMRHTDDLADEGARPRRRQALAWRGELDAAIAGQATLARAARPGRHGRAAAIPHDPCTR